MDNSANYTPRAQQVVQLARMEADRFNHPYVGTEHLLLGLIALGQGVAVTVLEKMGISLESVRMEVEKAVGQGPETKTVGNVPLTPRAKKVLQLAAAEARALNHTYIGTGGPSAAQPQRGHGNDPDRDHEGARPELRARGGSRVRPEAGSPSGAQVQDAGVAGVRARPD